MKVYDLAELSLFPATGAQIGESRRRTAQLWNKGLTLEQYLHRDFIMDSREHAAEGKLVTWYVATSFKLPR